MQPRLRLSRFVVFLPVLAFGFVRPSPAEAACTLSACDASALTACCTASTCTIDGTLTVSGDPCTFDFGARNLTVSGQILAQGKTITLKAKSMKLTGLVDVRGPGGANAGNVTIVTTGMTALAFSQEGGTSAIINASSSNASGGNVVIQADGMVSFAKGSVVTDGSAAGSGGSVSVSTTAGDVSVQIPISASSPLTATTPHGSISVTTPGSLAVGGSGRLVADLGTIDLDATGDATFADGSVVEANNGGGSITLTAGSVTGYGEFRAAGDEGSISLEAVTGPMLLSRLSQGITVGAGFQSLSLATDADGDAGLLTMDTPIAANGADVDIESSGSIVVSKKIETTGTDVDISAGDITVSAALDVDVTKAIVGADVHGEADLSIDGRDVTIEGNLDMRGGLDTPGGTIEVSAVRDLVIQGDIFLNVSGADSSDAGSIDLQAGRNITVAAAAELDGDGSPIGAGATITLLAGEGLSEHLPGNVTFQGDVKANGHLTNAASTAGSLLLIQGCDVTIPSGAIFDVSGDPHSTNQVIARKSLTIAGQLKATQANILEFPETVTPSLTGSFTPARSAGACTNGTMTADGCQRPFCTAPNTPTGCLYKCPTRGDNVTEFPETCDIGAGGPFCSGNDLCNAQCREQSCASPNPCVTGTCDAASGSCKTTLKPDSTACDADDNVCTGVGTCSSGICRLTPGSVLHCDDQNPCTGDPQSGVDTCDPITGCNHTPLDGPRAGCNDGIFCNGNETCVSGQCQSGPLPCVNEVPPKVCNPDTQLCMTPPACQNASDCADDGNPCTTTVCSAGQCTYPAVAPGTNCDDGDACNGVRTCNASGVCQQPTPPIDCDDGDVCTDDSCNSLSGQCSHMAIPGCCSAGTPCNDHDACTADTCNADHTCSFTAIVCNDGNPCTTDSCDMQNGCVSTPIPNCQPCADVSTCPDDADVCTDKACLAGRCQQIANPNCCNTNQDCLDIDSNPCTDNGSCNAHRCGTPIPLTGTACGTPCSPKTCQNGTCVADPPMDCNDNNPCTTDLCTDDQGCIHTHIDQCCFTSGECNDNNVCTTDTCDLDKNGCDHLQTDVTCVPCLGTDPFECGPRCSHACQGGRCAEVAPPCVTDGNPCTVCDDVTGCKALDGVAADGCDDGKACNGAERCVAGVCQHQPSPECDDNDLCTDDSCDDASGCVNVEKTSYDAVRCRLDGMTGDVNGAAAADMNAKLKKKTLAKLKGIEKKLDKTPSLKCKKAKSSLVQIAKQLRALQKGINRVAGHQIDPGLAVELGTLAGDGASQADTIRAGLGC